MSTHHRKYKIAIFVDGDYWHGNQYKLRGFRSIEEQLEKVSNKDYWIKKIKNNIKRDKEVTRLLTMDGWLVIRVWESQINDDIEKCIHEVIVKIRNRIGFQ